jgi:hypothetical protein
VERVRPGNFKIVIQNIWYLFAMSDTRCSVSNTDRPPRFGGRPEPRNPAALVLQTNREASRSRGILRACGPLNYSEMQYLPSCQSVSSFAEEPYRR